MEKLRKQWPSLKNKEALYFAKFISIEYYLLARVNAKDAIYNKHMLYCFSYDLFGNW